MDLVNGFRVHTQNKTFASELHSLIFHFVCFLGVSEYLSTEICTSRQKRFSLVTFVDSPGLVDGDMKYPFDVDEIVMWLGVGRVKIS